jgi:hypothetical protein
MTINGLLRHIGFRARFPRQSSLSATEKALIDVLGDWWNAYCKLPDRHLTEENEVASMVHELQRIIMARVAERTDPDVFKRSVRSTRHLADAGRDPRMVKYERS